MLLTAVLLLTLAALAGATLALLHGRGFPVPFAAGLVHGGAATTGVLLLAVAVWQASRPIAVNAALLCFAMSLVGGVFVLLFRLQGESPPGFMILLHAAVALVALTLLWVGVTGV